MCCFHHLVRQEAIEGSLRGIKLNAFPLHHKWKLLTFGKEKIRTSDRSRTKLKHTCVVRREEYYVLRSDEYSMARHEGEVLELCLTPGSPRRTQPHLDAGANHRFCVLTQPAVVTEAFAVFYPNIWASSTAGWRRGRGGNWNCPLHRYHNPAFDGAE